MSDHDVPSRTIEDAYTVEDFAAAVSLAES
jgi:hypothetical protein